MKLIKSLTFLLIILAYSCTGSHSQNSATSLSVVDFSKKIKELPEAPILDVRTPEEFENGHLKGAKNIDWNADDFDSKIAGFDKNQVVFVYCLSGGRSSSAAEKMRSIGFKQVYEMEGGIMKWRSQNLELEVAEGNSEKTGMSSEQFASLVTSTTPVLVDFYADWCVPCKKMKPYLDELTQEYAGKIKVVRINADENAALCKSLQIDALPVLLLYKNNSQVWKNIGFIDKNSVVTQLQAVE
ncbi:MAG: redoxin domain-containing protein [Bacteroidia bacterium]|nr:redoxin domain-containing protein [Bacteroidia bacterium]